MDSHSLILKIKLLLLAWLHRRSRPGPVLLLKQFSYKDIRRATDDFQRIIHNSPHGATYKAKFRNGTVTLVKEVRAFNVDDDAFYRELQLIGCLHHRHIVGLSGFSLGHKRFLVFENVENGSLKEHLNDPLKTPLAWRTRLQIAVGVAAALEYLHFFCDPPMYHVSISSSTIMLDENFTAKLSDVGTFRSSENVKETPASCSEKLMVQACGNIIFQLGLLILELITGQSSEKGHVDIIQWVQGSHFPRSMHKMIDPDLGNNYDSRELKGLLAVARLCIKSKDTPTNYIPQIFWYLQKKLGIV